MLKDLSKNQKNCHCSTQIIATKRSKIFLFIPLIRNISFWEKFYFVSVAIWKKNWDGLGLRELKKQKDKLCKIKN